jgi:hypothetical protein
MMIHPAGPSVSKNKGTERLPIRAQYATIRLLYNQYVKMVKR